jgi:toxin ParE1/3/4
VDLKHIYRYIAEFNPLAAASTIRELYAKAQMLAGMPGMAQGVPHLSPGLRRFPVGNYAIFYRPINDGIDVIRVLHTARDLEALFAGLPS